MADFATTCVSKVMTTSQAAVTLTNGVDYTVPGGVQADGCLFWISSTRKTGMGSSSGGGNQQPSDFGVWLGAASDGITNIQLRRNNVSTTENCRVTITIVSVTNPTSSSRFWVRDRGAISFGSSDTVVSGPTIPDSGVGGGGDSVLDPTRVWVCVTGQQTDETNRGRAHTGKFTAKFDSNAAELSRGTSGAAATGSYAVVEFASDWKAVQRLAFNSPDDGTNIWDSTGAPTYANKALNIPLAITTDLSGSALSNTARAFIDPQYRNSNRGNQGNDAQGEVVELTGTNQLTIRKSTNRDFGDKRHVVWIIEWDGPAGATPPVATHYSHWVVQSEEGAEEGEISRTVTTVANLNTACVIGGSSSSDGTGNGTPRGNVDLCLTSATNVSEKRSETSRWERRAYTVFEWPEGASGARGTFALQAHNPGAVALATGSPGPIKADSQHPGSVVSTVGLPGVLKSDSQQPGSVSTRVG